MHRCHSEAPANLPGVIFTDDDCVLAGALSIAPKGEPRHHLYFIWRLVDKNAYAHIASVLERGPQIGRCSVYSLKMLGKVPQWKY